MEYKKAAEIRNKGLLSLIAENKFREGKGLGASIGGAISQKFKAKATGIKESFDPLNIVRKMTGKGTFGRIATTIAGRAMGKSEKDISYFGGYTKKVKHHYVDTNVSPLEHDGEYGGSAHEPIAGILGEMYQFMQQTHDVDKKDYEIQQAFLEEQNSDAETRHKQLVRAIKKYVKVPTKEAEKSEGGGILDWIMNFVNKIKDEIMKIIDPFLNFFNKLGSLGWLSFLAMAPGAGLIALLAGIGISAYLLQKLADSTPNMKALSPEEAHNVLKNATSERDIESQGGRAKLEDTIKNGKKKAQELLNMPEGEEKDKSIINAGGLDKVKKIAEDTKQYTVPEKTELGPEKVKSKDEWVKNSRKTKVAAAEQWDKLWGKNYNEDGTKKAAPKESENPAITPTKASSPSTEPASSVTIPKSTTIPQQTADNSESNSTQPVVAMNSTTNNIGGGPAQSYNMNPIAVRNGDLFKFLRNSAVPV